MWTVARIGLGSPSRRTPWPTMPSAKEEEVHQGRSSVAGLTWPRMPGGRSSSGITMKRSLARARMVPSVVGQGGLVKELAALAAEMAAADAERRVEGSGAEIVDVEVAGHG